FSKGLGAVHRGTPLRYEVRLRAIAAGSIVRRVLRPSARAQQRVDARSALGSGIELKIELRRVAQPKCMADLAADESACALESRNCGRGTRAPLEVGEENPSVAQV